jgi:bla regulator protein BlaR1
VLDLGMADFDVRSHRFDVFFRNAWLASSLVLLAGLLLSGGLLYWRKRRWTQGTLCGTSILVAPDAGPAVVGLLRPLIVVPAWLLQESLARQRFVIAHEQSHLDARDPQLLTIALSLLVIMPWNVPLWWQFHRLRRAIEVDCDARVLRGDKDVAAYCETLIQVGEKQSRYIGAMAAMSESGSFLEQRIKIMLLKPRKWARLSALAMIGVSVGVAAFAAQVTPPSDSSAPTRQQVSVNPAVLADYVGFYKFAPYSVMTVKLDGSQLVAQLTGQGPLPIFPSSPTEFFAKLVNAQISFIQGTAGKTTGLVLHQNGHDTTAPRIDSTAAQKMQAALAARVSSQQPFPGSEADLQIILGQNSGSPVLSPSLAKARREQKAKLDAYLSQLGPVTSHQFIGVSAQGWDKYLVRHASGSEEVSFVLDNDGTIVGASRHP